MDNPPQKPLPLPLPMPGGLPGGFNPLAPPPGSAPVLGPGMQALFTQGFSGQQAPPADLPMVLPPLQKQRLGTEDQSLPYETEPNGLHFLDFLRYWSTMATPFQPVVIRASAFRKGIKVNTLAQILRGGKAWVLKNCEATDPSMVDVARRTSFQEKPMQDCVAVTAKAAENPFISAIEEATNTDFPLLQAELIAWINSAPGLKPDARFERHGLNLSIPEQQWIETQLRQLPAEQYVFVINPVFFLIQKRGGSIAGVIN